MPAESSDLSRTPTHGDEPDFAALAQLRRGLAELDAFVQSAGGGHGCSAAMYQLLLALKTSGRGSGVDIGMLATALRVRHPSAAEMVRKAETAGFLLSMPDVEDGRRVLVSLSDVGEQVVSDVADSHQAELRRLRPAIVSALHALG